MLRGPCEALKRPPLVRVRRYNWYRAASPRGSCSRFQGPGGERYDKEGEAVEEVGEERGRGEGGIEARW